MGYYSNENHSKQNGNARILDGDNDGPLTEMMDHSLGQEGNNNNFAGKINVTNENTENATNDRRDNHLFSRNDVNYHAHLGDNVRKPRSSYYQAYEGNFIERINRAAANVNNVKEVQSVTNGSNVLIAAVLSDYSRKDTTIDNIENAVRPYLNGKSSRISIDQATYNRVKSIDNELRDGGPREQINLDVQNIFRSENR